MVAFRSDLFGKFSSALLYLIIGSSFAPWVNSAHVIGPLSFLLRLLFTVTVACLIRCYLWFRYLYAKTTGNPYLRMPLEPSAGKLATPVPSPEKKKRKRKNRGKRKNKSKKKNPSSPSSSPSVSLSTTPAVIPGTSPFLTPWIDSKYLPYGYTPFYNPLPTL